MSRLAFAALAALTLGACATTDNGNGGATASRPAAGTQYCWAGRLEPIGTKFSCNWAPTKSAACEGADFSTVDGAGYAPPRTTSMCANGRWLVELAPRG